MAQITIEDKKRLRQLVAQLEDVNNLLHTIYENMVQYLIRSYLYLILWTVLIVMSRYYINSINSSILFFSANCLIYVILTLYFHLLIKPTNKRYEQVYHRGLTILGTLINYVDWEVYRKKQLYNENDTRVENVIDGFLKYARKNISPKDSKNKIFNLLLILQIIFRNGAYLYALIIFFKYLNDFLY